MDKQLLKNLCTIDGVSGRESAVREFILSQLASYDTPHQVTVDAMGNVIVHLIGKKTASQRVLLDAHMDEVGFLISHITQEGYLRFETVGSIDKQVLCGTRVRVGGQIGVISGKAYHHCSADDRNRIPNADELLVDIGAADSKEAEKLVHVGQAGTFDEAFTLEENNRFVGKAVDDRVGCALLLTLAQEQPPYDIWLSFSVQEEVGLRGASVVGETVKPNVAIALDATTAADIAGSSRESAVCHIGSGAVVSFADRATLYDVDLYHEIRNLAEQHGIPTQTKNRIAGGNNAAAIQRSHVGVRMAAISLPTRYIHSPVCMGNWSDVDAMEDLLRLLVERLPA